jgi:hypothetical protein
MDQPPRGAYGRTMHERDRPHRRSADEQVATARGLDAIPALQAGNRAFAQLLGRAPLQNVKPRKPAPGPLTVEEEDDAADAANERFAATEIRILQLLLGTPLTGRFGPVDAQASAIFKRAKGAGRDGIVNPKAIDALVVEAASRDLHDEAIRLVMRRYTIDTSAETLSVHFDRTVRDDANLAFEGKLRTILVGRSAFTSGTTLRDTIIKWRDEPSLRPGAPPLGILQPGQRVLTADEAAAAVEFNNRRLRDRRAIMSLQMAVGVHASGTIDRRTVEALGAWQKVRRIGLHDGKLDLESLERLVHYQATFGAGPNSAIRLAVEYHRLDSDAVLDVRFDDTLTTEGELRGAGTGLPVALVFGPPLFSAGGPQTMHTIARLYAQARLSLQGAKAGVREFMGSATEILAGGMSEEHFGGPAGGFVQDAIAALARFKALAPADQLAVWSKFDLVRDKVRERIRAAALPDRRATADLLRDYNAVVRP